MRKKIIFPSLFLAMAALGSLQVIAQQEEDVRGAFLTTRPKTTEKTTSARKPSRRRPKAVSSPASPTTPAVTGEKTVTVTIAGSGTAVNSSRPRMGLGLTMFMRDSNGLAVRTDPSREFRKGDRVRVLLETNGDGYLYIFNTTNGGQPVMIYPDPELDEAGNYIQGHVPFEIPSSLAAEERLRWFTFDQNSGAEKLYFVFTREPLAGVPMEDGLIAYCRENAGKCPWRPGTEVWEQIGKELGEPTKVVKSQTVGTAQTPGEHQAATRGIGLNRDDPEPSLIRLTTSTNKNMLVAPLDLNHKAEIGTPVKNP
ncbi:MAG: DUF4384 domain-containing protein [Acidobacteriota bacterium]